MPKPTELLGPFPPGADEEAYDRLRRRVLWMLPAGIYLIGARAGGVANLMTANLVTQVATAPKLLAAAIESDAITLGLVLESKAFALSLVGRADRALVRTFARPAEEDHAAKTLGGQRYRDAAVTGSPLLAAAVAYLDCRVRDQLALGSHCLVIGEVVDAGSTAGPGDDPIEVLRMEDTRMSYGG